MLVLWLCAEAASEILYVGAHARADGRDTPNLSAKVPIDGLCCDVGPASEKRLGTMPANSISALSIVVSATSSGRGSEATRCTILPFSREGGLLSEATDICERRAVGSDGERTERFDIQHVRNGKRNFTPRDGIHIQIPSLRLHSQHIRMFACTYPQVHTCTCCVPEPHVQVPRSRGRGPEKPALRPKP